MSMGPWEMTLHCNIFSHWLSSYPKWCWKGAHLTPVFRVQVDGGDPSAPFSVIYIRLISSRLAPIWHRVMRSLSSMGVARRPCHARTWSQFRQQTAPIHLRSQDALLKVLSIVHRRLASFIRAFISGPLKRDDFSLILRRSTNMTACETQYMHMTKTM